MLKKHQNLEDNIELQHQILHNYENKKDEEKDTYNLLKLISIVVIIVLIVMGVFWLTTKYFNHQDAQRQQQEVNYQTIVKYANLHDYKSTKQYIQANDGGNIIHHYRSNEYIPQRAKVDVKTNNIQGPSFNGNNKQTLVVYRLKTTGPNQYLLINYRNVDKKTLMVDISSNQDYQHYAKLTEKILQEMSQQARSKKYNTKKILQMKAQYDKGLSDED